MSKNKSLTVVGLSVLAAGVIAASLYYVGNSNAPIDKPKDDLLSKEVIASHVLSYKQDGTVSLYGINDGKLLGDFDLKTLSENKDAFVEVVAEPVQAPVPTPSPEPKPETKPAPSVETFGNYVQVPIIVKKGQNAWRIQFELTPKLDMTKMLGYVKEVNKRSELHPIYPGEKIIFLKEKNGETETEEKPPVVVEEPKEVVKETPKVVKNAERYLYYGDTENKFLYALSNVDHEIYRIAETNGAIDVKEAFKNEEFVVADDFVVTKNQLILTQSGTNVIQIVDVTDASKVQTVELEGDPSHIVVSGDVIYYTFDKRMGKFDLKTGEKSSVQLGDESLNLVLLQDKLFVLNKFGVNSTNSLLMKVNPSDLKVDSLLEMKTDEAAILSKGEKDDLFVGRVEKEVDLSGNQVRENKIVPIDVKSLSMNPSKWTMPFSKESMGYEDHLYMLQDGKLNIYQFNDVKPMKSVEVKGEHFIVLP